MTKVCARCGRRLSLSNFGKTKKGYRKVCKECNEHKKLQVNAKYKGKFWLQMDKLLCSE